MATVHAKEEKEKEKDDDDVDYDDEERTIALVLQEEEIARHKASIKCQVCSIYPTLAYPAFEDDGEDAALWIRYFYKVVPCVGDSVGRAAAQFALRGALIRLGQVSNLSGYSALDGSGEGDDVYMHVLWWCTGVVWALLDGGLVDIDDVEREVGNMFGDNEVGRSVLLASAWLAGGDACRAALSRWRDDSRSESERAMIDGFLSGAAFPIDDTPVNTVDIGWKMELMAGHFYVSGSLAVLQHFIDLVRYTKTTSTIDADSPPYEIALLMANVAAKQKLTVLMLQHRLARDFVAGRLGDDTSQPILVDDYVADEVQALVAKVDDKIASALSWPEPSPKSTIYIS